MTTGVSEDDTTVPTTDLGDSILSLQLMLARPGAFGDTYTESTEDLLLQVLMDALAEAHLLGLLKNYSSDTDGIVSPALDSGQVALVVLFGAVRFLRAELLNRNTSVVYEAGGARYETTQATNILRDILKALQAQKDAVVSVSSTNITGAFSMADQYLARMIPDYVPAGW